MPERNYADRDQNEADINSLYGCPGSEYESETGERLLMQTLASYGLSAFTDEFVMMLAAKHREEDNLAAARAEADYRRSLRA